MDDNQPDPVAPDREEPDHTDDPRDTERSDQRPEEGPAVHAAFAAVGLRPVRELREEGWSTLLMERA